MVQVSYPGVYVREIPSGVSTITGVPTSIAVFIGMAKRGPINIPSRVLGYLDYTRTFSADTSLGEMTDQVRQYFQNGGQQAFIVRIAHDAQAASLVLNASGGAALATIALSAISQGSDGGQLRASVDYNTPNPEGTFNLSIYREVIDASGNASIQDLETFKNVSMDSASPRFVETAVNQGSALVSSEATVTPPTTAGYSIGALLGRTLPSGGGYAGSTPEETLVNAVQAVIGTAAGSIGRFKVKIGSRNLVEVTLTTGATPYTAATLTAAIDDAIRVANSEAAAITETTIVTAANLAFLRIQAETAGEDVTIERGSDHDIAQALGLGLAQGGIEVSAYAGHRPSPNGYVSTITDSAATSVLASLLTFGGLAKTAFGGLTLEGSQRVEIPANAVRFPIEGSTDRPSLVFGTVDGVGLGTDGAIQTGVSLLNLRENLAAIATAINGAQTKWRAQVHGYRLALTPTFGTASSGPGHSINGTVGTGWTGLQTSPQIFAGVSSTVVAAPFTVAAGADGTAPLLQDYLNAFTAIDSNVDLFNLMVLPRSTITAAAEDDRTDVWGPASEFCVKRRAFLLMDADSTKVEDVLNEVMSLRIGLAKDHAALYWPRLTIPTGNGFVKQIDPSGSVAGLMGRIDATKGVWKAPAGLDSDIRAVRGVQTNMSDSENGLLNPQAINAIRVFPNGIISWGARTMDGFDNSGNDDFKYVPVRRFELFLEESLVRGLKFAVFQPNAEPLWSQIRLAVGAFMNNLFRQGAFAGRTVRDSYFVKVDSETTTQNDINLGIVNVLVGFAPLKPAEFVVVTIQQMAGQVQV